MKAVVRPGPSYNPEPELVVEVLYASHMPGFFICRLADGTKRVFHKHNFVRLFEVEPKENPS